MTWGYRFEPASGGTDVTECFQLTDRLPLRLSWELLGKARGATDRRNMETTLERIKAAAER
jgi:hypothetical protein